MSFNKCQATALNAEQQTRTHTHMLLKHDQIAFFFFFLFHPKPRSEISFKCRLKKKNSGWMAEYSGGWLQYNPAAKSENRNICAQS